MADTSHVRIDALDVNNWATWNIRMKALLIQKGLWAMIGPAAEGDGEVDEARDQKALALMVRLNLSIMRQVRHDVCSCVVT